MDIFELARETFGTVKASWAAELKAMGDTHSPEALEAAFGSAKEYGAGDLAYVRKVLKQRDAKPSAAKPYERLLCDACDLPTRIDNMTVCLGRGLCRDCADTPVDVGWKRIFGVLGKAAESGLAQVLYLGDLSVGADDFTQTAKRVDAHWAAATSSP